MTFSSRHQQHRVKAYQAICCGGFSLIELAIVLLITGVMLALFSGYAVNAIKSGSNQIASDRLAGLSNILLAFAQDNYRLPCPDTNNDGVEDCTGASTTSPLRGAVPFRTLLLEQPFIGRKGGEVVYAVAADLWNTHDIDTPSWRMSVEDRRDMCDFMAGLIRRAPTTADLAVADPGVTNCAAASLTNPAFLLVDSGSGDLDGVNGLFDGLNGVTANNCFNAPVTPNSNTYDDTVQVFGMAHLLGSLCQ